MRDMTKRVAVLLLCACGPTRTFVFDGCEDVCSAIIQGGIDCRIITERDRTEFTDACVNGCCGNTRTCQDKLRHPNNIDDCIERLSTQGCDEVSRGVLPPICKAVVAAE